MSGDPCAGGNLPWKSEVLSPGRGLQGRGRVRLKKASRGGPGAARETSLSVLSSCVHSHISLQPPACSRPRVLHRRHTHRVLEKPVVPVRLVGLPDTWEKAGEPPRIVFPGLREQRGDLGRHAYPWPGSEQRSLHPPSPSWPWGRCGLPRSSTCPPLTSCLSLVGKRTLTCSDLCRMRHTFHFKNL